MVVERGRSLHQTPPTSPPPSPTKPTRLERVWLRQTTPLHELLVCMILLCRNKQNLQERCSYIYHHRSHPWTAGEELVCHRDCSSDEVKLTRYELKSTNRRALLALNLVLNYTTCITKCCWFSLGTPEIRLQFPESLVCTRFVDRGWPGK